MMRSLNFLLVLSIVLLVASCGNTYKKSVSESIQLDDYTVYVFRLCETRNELGNKRFFLCDSSCEPTDVQANDTIQVVEELYAFQSKTNPERIIYITSKSDKDIKENRGIFNDSLYQDYIFVFDFEYVYFGSLTDQMKISFVSANENLSFQLQPVPEDCRFLVDSIHSDTDVKNAISNKKISMLDLFSVDIQFIETDRKLAYKRQFPERISTLNLTGNRLLFIGETKVHSLSQRLRLKYHPSFVAEQSELLRKTSN